jgi:hypothetical protein
MVHVWFIGFSALTDVTDKGRLVHRSLKQHSNHLMAHVARYGSWIGAVQPPFTVHGWVEDGPTKFWNLLILMSEFAWR